MQAMLIEEEAGARARLAAALAEAGFEVAAAADAPAAKAALRRGIHDVLILSERLGGRLAHDVVLLAETRHPGIGTLLVTERRGPEVAEIFELLPSVHAVLGRRTPAREVARLALAAARREEGAAAFPEAGEAPPPLFRVPVRVADAAPAPGPHPVPHRPARRLHLA